jgi:hypothetical protein
LSNPSKPVTIYSTADILENVSARHLPDRTLKRGVRGLCPLIKIFVLKTRRHEESWILTNKSEKSEIENQRAKKGKRNIQGKHLTRKL